MLEFEISNKLKIARLEILNWRFVFFLLLLLSACGKEGPPLSPFIRVPQRVKVRKAIRRAYTLPLTRTTPARIIDATAATTLAHVQTANAAQMPATLHVNPRDQ